MEKQFTIFIDGESFEAPERQMKANDLLILAGLAVAEYYLVAVHGKNQDSFEGRGDEEINLHEGIKFISVFTGATGVAATSETGSGYFAAQLRELGYDVTELPDGHVKFPYMVEIGSRAGTQVEQGFVVPDDFPLTPPHGPHVSPEIHPLQRGGAHPTGGIHEPQKVGGKHFGAGWQHWSRPHPNWADGKRTVARYMAFIRKLWATQ